MAAIVGALGVPHTPFFPALVEREGPQCETARFFAAVTAELEATRRVQQDALAYFKQLEAQFDQQRQQLARRHQLNALLGLAPDVAVPLDPTPSVPAWDPDAVAQALP